MIDLDLSSIQYVEMCYFIDRLLIDAEARIAYYDRQLIALGVNPEDIDKPSFNSSDYYNPSSVDYFLELLQHDKEFIENQKLLKKSYMSLLSFSEHYVCYNTDNKSLPDEVDTMKKRVKKLKLREIERSKFSSELHDSSIQILTGLVHKCELICRLIDFDIPRSKMELSSVISDLKTAISDIREFIFNMRAPSLSDFSLVESLEDYCSYKNKDRSVKVSITSEGVEGDFSPIYKSNLYRICQEAFNNILKHSEADRANIKIVYGDERIDLIVSDNGKGFDESVLSSERLGKKNFGLLIMRERSEIIGGTFSIKSLDTGGTEVRVSVPRKPEDLYE